MRPNIDVPWSTHGSVREYADAHGYSVEEAYLELIDGGLEDFNHLADGPTVNLGGETSGEVVFMEKPDRTATSPIFVFAATADYDETGWLEYVQDSVMITGDGYAESVEELGDMCQRIAPYLENRKNSGDFTISHEDGYWVGRGLDTFYQTFINKNQRYNKNDYTELSNREEAIFVAPISHSSIHSKHVIVNGSQIANPDAGDTFRGAGVAVIVHGYPFGRSGNWYKLLDHTGGTKDIAEPFQTETLELSFPYELEVANRITECRGESSDEVAKFVVKNPLYQQESEVEEVLTPTQKSLSTVPLHELEYLIGVPRSNHDFDENPDLKVSNFVIERFLRGGIFYLNLDITLRSRY